MTKSQLFMIRQVAMIAESAEIAPKDLYNGTHEDNDCLPNIKELLLEFFGINDEANLYEALFIESCKNEGIINIENFFHRTERSLNEADAFLKSIGRS